MSARMEIFKRLKDALDPIHNPTVRQSRADQNIREAGPGLIPQRGKTEQPARTALFVDEATQADADIRRLTSLEDVVVEVRTILNEVGGGCVKITPHQKLQAMDWSGLDVAFGTGAGEDHVGLSWASAGVAETGTLVLCSGPESSTTLNFLPDLHMVVLREEDIAANYEEVWAQLRQGASSTAPVMPRTVNWITGPSRTADIEQTLLLGAHGPRKLVILLIDAEATLTPPA